MPAELLKALADETRLRLALACRGRELCVCQLLALVRLAPSTVSQHLKVLAHAGVLASRKEGRWMHYRLAEPPEPEAAIVRAALDAFARTPKGRGDARSLREILRLDLEALCLILREGGCCSSAPGTPAAAKWPRAGRARSTRA
ncbi:MAG TPA: metalloregulator ArsR/SmtB family transcription factor [Phycisphaerales bacterium]|nr:metalloregulator ArsR/SmtB family transcription factor [Phycisphaerales bacterium]